MKKLNSFILSLLFLCGCGRTVSVMDIVEESGIIPVRDVELNVADEKIIMTSNGVNAMGVSLNHEYDLTPFSVLRFTLKNESSLSLYFSLTLIESGASARTRATGKGYIQKMYSLPAGQSKTYEMQFPAVLPHPEIDEMFKSMRTTPYAHLTGLYSYNADLSAIDRIEIVFRRCNVGTRVTLSDMKFFYGERRCAEGLNLSREEFFPFIDRYGQFKHSVWKGKIRSDEDFALAYEKECEDLEANPGPSDRSRFGGWKNGPRLEATGRFRVEKYDGKWWLVDPEGYLFWSHGVVRVTPSSAITPLDGRHQYFEDLPDDDSDFAQFYHTHDALLKPYYTARNIKETYDYSSANCYRKYGPDYRIVYAELAHRRLKSWGLNTIANSSDKDICLMDKTPYMDRLEVRSRPIEGSGGMWWPFMDPFDPSFTESIESQLSDRQREIQDPWLIGLFVDNEIRWGNIYDLARTTVMAPADQPAKIAFAEFLRTRYAGINELNEAWNTDFSSWDMFMNNRDDVPVEASADLKEFNEIIIHKYYSNIRTAFDKYAPGVLYMGCRFAGGSSGSNESVISIGKQYCDVISYNIYCHELHDFPFPEGFDMPVMVGEFHFGALDRGVFHGTLIDVGTQDERGKAYETYVRSALEHPNFIGTHWHQFSDQAATGRFDGENFQVGFTDCCDTPYYETISYVRKVGYDMYSIRSGGNVTLLDY